MSTLYQTEQALLTVAKPFNWHNLALGATGGMGCNLYIEKEGLYLIHRGGTVQQRFWLMMGGLMWRRKRLRKIEEAEMAEAQHFQGKSPKELLMRRPDNVFVNFAEIQKAKFNKWGSIRHYLHPKLKLNALTLTTMDRRMVIWFPKEDTETIKQIMMGRCPTS